MRLKDLLEVYTADPLWKSCLEAIGKANAEKFWVQGLAGSADALMISLHFQMFKGKHLIVANDKEEAAYLQNDLLKWLGEAEVLLYPSSFKKPYQVEDTDNANVLQRAEVLSKLNQPDQVNALVVTYPEALTEKVVSKRSLVENTLTAKVGEKVDIQFMAGLLADYEFEKTDFVFEPGQYAIRGGIMDVYSFSNELPFRLELFGNEIESIRTFDPNTQLSVDHKNFITIIPNVQNKLILETTESVSSFFDANSFIWVKQMSALKEVLNGYHQRASIEYQQQAKKAGGTQLSTDPDTRFETFESFSKGLEGCNLIEMSNKPYYTSAKSFSFQLESQPAMGKDFSKFAACLQQFQQEGIGNFLLTESPSQYDKLQSILEELAPFVKIQHLHIGLREGFVDRQARFAFFTDHQLFERFFRTQSKERHSKTKSLTLKELKTLHPGDFVTHIDYGVAKFVGMEKILVNGHSQEAIRLLFRDDDMMKISINALHKISKYSGKEGGPPTMSKLGSPDWENKKKNVKKKLKELAIDLISLYAKRKAAPGFAFSKDTYLQAELETSFVYEDTPDQAKASEDVKADMEKPHPMDRLVCGDVGFGKTEVAIRAAFKAACEGKQVAVMVPTTILAMQHYKTFKERLSNFPVRVEYVSRFRTSAQIKETLKRVAEGKTEILVGTHRIVSKDVHFKNLGLLIIDEEQKFGVGVKEKLKEFKVNVDTLTLTATPIPRTLHFSLMGARDLSIIATPPPNRQPVTTEVHTYNEALLRDAIDQELKRGGQVFLVHNKVSDIESFANTVVRLVPEARVVVAHGQMEGEALEKAMLKFIDAECDVLVSTNIIESGLDIPNANTIIIHNAHHFGMSDLHQMRGRVGRSNRKAYCYLLTPPPEVLSGESKRKLAALEEFSELGDGFKVAMRDLDIRGAGNLLGAEQSGFISDLGFDLYHKLLDEAMQELKEHEFRSLFENQLQVKVDTLPDCVIESDLSTLIPESYVGNISERLSLYTELDRIDTEEKLIVFGNQVKDRFGPLPLEVEDLMQTVRLRWIAEKLGFEKISIKNQVMKCQFSGNLKESYYQSDVFGSILRFAQKNPSSCALKELKGKQWLQIEAIDSYIRAKEILGNILHVN